MVPHLLEIFNTNFSRKILYEHFGPYQIKYILINSYYMSIYVLIWSIFTLGDIWLFQEIFLPKALNKCPTKYYCSFIGK